VRGIIVVSKSEALNKGSFYIVGRDLSKILDFPVMGLDKKVYPFLGMPKLDVVISIGTLSTIVLFTKLAALAALASRVFAYAAVEGIPRNLTPFSPLANLASKINKLHIVVPSEYARQELQGVGMKVEMVIPHGVDLKEINRARNSEDIVTPRDEKIQVLSVFSSLFQERKRLGLYLLLLAWSRLSKETRKNAKIVLKVPAGTADVVEQIARSLKLAKNEYVILDQWFSRDLMLNSFRSADIYLHGTLADAFGLPLIESMACGTPVIALNAQPWNEIVNEEVGWLVDIEKEILVRRSNSFSLIQRLRIPKIGDLSSKIENAIQFCYSRNYQKLSQRCVEHASKFDIHRTYSIFKDLIENDS